MNRLEKRAAILKESEQMEILSICQSVKNGMDGMADDWKDEEVLRINKFLICCLDTWEPTSFKPSLNYDNCVKNLIVETIRLITHYLGKRDESNRLTKRAFYPNI